MSADAEPSQPSTPAASADPVAERAAAPAADRASALVAAPGVHPHHGPFHTHCENCGTKLAGPWCHQCGQHDFEFHRSFWHVFLEALETIFHFEGKFFRNVVTLLFQPGRLTAEFNAGKRAAQMPPFRLYLFVSFAFFLLLVLGPKPDGSPLRFGAGPGIGPAKAGPPDTFDRAKDEIATRSINDLRQQAEERHQRKLAERESPQAEKTPGPHRKEQDISQTLEAKAREALKPEVQRAMVHSFFVALPKMLLFCLPLFALFTWVLFRQAGFVYLQHLVVAVHFHTFIYLWVMFRDGWSFVLHEFASRLVGNLVVLACNLWLLLYPFLMLRRLFAQSWPWTILKTGFLGLAYGITLLAAFFATAIILFLLL